jgi:hypothetical protein
MMLCPMKFFVLSDSMARKKEVECYREDCSWWIESKLNGGQCAVRVLLQKLENIALATGIMADR